MARLGAPRSVEVIAEAMGIDCSKHNVLDVTLRLDPRNLPIVDVRYYVRDEDIPALTEVLRKYKLVPIDGEG